MISISDVETVAAFLRAGKSVRETARHTGLARGTVAAIAVGKHPQQLRPRSDEWALAVDELCGPPVRCPTCGAKVVMPCIACAVRRIVAGRVLPK
jgi:hypothetical protein